MSVLLPQYVDARSYIRLSEFLAFVWVEKFSLGSKVKPRMVGLVVLVEMEALLMWVFSGLYSEGSEIMSVVMVRLICRLLE